MVAGTGDVTFTGAMGATTSLGGLNVSATGDTTFSENFTGSSLTNSGPAIVSNNIQFKTTGAINFGSTLDSSNGSQTITFVTASDITITGVVGGSNPFSSFTVDNNVNNFRYNGGGSIANLRLSSFDQGPSIETNNTIEKTQDKEIAFFDAPVFKLINSFLTSSITDLFRATDQNNVPVDADIQVDFLDGDTLIIENSLELASNEFDSLETNIEEILDDLLIDDSSDVSINSTAIELFKTSSLNQVNNKSNLDSLLISFSKSEDLNQGKSFIF